MLHPPPAPAKPETDGPPRKKKKRKEKAPPPRRQLAPPPPDPRVDSLLDLMAAAQPKRPKKAKAAPRQPPALPAQQHVPPAIPMCSVWYEPPSEGRGEAFDEATRELLHAVSRGAIACAAAAVDARGGDDE